MPTGFNSGRKAVISWQATAGKPQSTHPPGCIQSILAICVATPTPSEQCPCSRLCASAWGGCSSTWPKGQPAGMGLLPTKPLRDGDHPQPPREALPSPLKPCEDLSCLPTLPWSEAQRWHRRPGGSTGLPPLCACSVPGSQQLSGFYQHPYQFLLLPHFFKPTTAPSRTLPQPTPAAPRYWHLSGVSGSSKAPVLRDTSSDVASSSDCLPHPGAMPPSPSSSPQSPPFSTII